MKNALIFTFWTLIFMISCSKDIDEVTNVVTETEPPIIISEYDPVSKNIQGTLIGKVVDSHFEPVPDAEFTINNQKYYTDIHGYVVLKDIEMDQYGTFFTVEKDGFYTSSKRFFPNEASTNFVTLELIERIEAGVFDSTVGGTINADEVTITFAPNSISLEGGNQYNGIVSVSCHYIDPSNDEELNTIPGNLQGVNRFLEEVSLASFGMIAVELYGENGEKLNLSEGNTAEISVPIPNSLLNTAPEEIPLWFFDEEFHGLWIEDGVAVKDGSKYIGNVSHFSFWNCDAPFPLVTISGYIQGDDGSVISNTTIKLEVIGSGLCGVGQTDQNGFFIGKVPVNENLKLSLVSNQICLNSNLIIGPFETDTYDQVLTLDYGDHFTSNIQGFVVDCNDMALSESIVVIEIEGQEIFHYLNGQNEFNLSVNYCNEMGEIEIYAIDPNSLERGESEIFSLEPSIHVGVLYGCGIPLENYYRITLGEESRFFPGHTILQIPTSGTGDPFHSFVGSENGSGNSGTNHFWIWIDYEEIFPVGSYIIEPDSILYFAFNFLDSNVHNSNLSNNCNDACSSEITLEILQSGDFLEYMIGYFEGTEDLVKENGEIIQDVPFRIDFKALIQ